MTFEPDCGKLLLSEFSIKEILSVDIEYELLQSLIELDESDQSIKITTSDLTLSKKSATVIVGIIGFDESIETEDFRLEINFEAEKTEKKLIQKQSAPVEVV